MPRSAGIDVILVEQQVVEGVAAVGRADRGRANDVAVRVDHLQFHHHPAERRVRETLDAVRIDVLEDVVAHRGRCDVVAEIAPLETWGSTDRYQCRFGSAVGTDRVPVAV